MNEQAKRGRHPGSFKHEELLDTNLNIRVSQTELKLLDRHAQLLKVARSDIFRGFIHELSAEPQPPKDGVPVTVGKKPLVLSRTEAKRLLKELTAKLVA